MKLSSNSSLRKLYQMQALFCWVLTNPDRNDRMARQRVSKRTSEWMGAAHFIILPHHGDERSKYSVDEVKSGI